MSSGFSEKLLWGFAGAAVLVGAVASSRAVPDIPYVQQVTLVQPALSRAIDSRTLSKAAEFIANSDPFRLARHPASIAFGAQTESPPDVPSQVPSRAPLRLAGIIGGPPWQAVLEGSPISPSGILVATGDLLGELRIRRVTPDTLVVQAPDTVWILTLERGLH